jgi:uncharacterized membrane protein YccC
MSAPKGRPHPLIRAEKGVLASLADAFRVDRTALQPRQALQATIGVAVPLIVGVILKDPVAGATASFGALTVGVALIKTGLRAPAPTMLGASICMAAATFVGCVTGLVPVVHLITLAVAGFFGGLLVAAGRGAAQVGVNALIALLVFGRFAADPGTAALHMTWVLLGGLFQTAVGIWARSPRPLRAQRAALADAYETLAMAATKQEVPLAAAEAAASARDTIRPWLQADDRTHAGPLRGLVDEADRIRQELHALRFQETALPRSGPGHQIVDDAIAAVAAPLLAISAALRHGRRAEGVEQAAEHLLAQGERLTGEAAQHVDADGEAAQHVDADGEAAQHVDADGEAAQHVDADGEAAASPAAVFCAARMAALAGKLRAVNRMTSQLAGIRRMDLPVAAANAADAMVVLPTELLSVVRQVRAATSPSSPAFRHGIRLAVVIPVATEISRFLPWQRGYWLPVAAVIVLKPDFSATVSRGVARVIGTGVGVIAGGVLVATIHPHGVTFIALIAVCAWLGYSVFAANYALYSLFLTALVILLVSAAESSAMRAVENRGFDTLIGGGLAIAAYLIWPTWEAGTLQAAAADRFEAIRRYLDAVLRACVDPQAYDQRSLVRLASGTRRAQSEVMASIGRARGEPAWSRPDIDRYTGILSAGRRIASGAHALASHLHDTRRQVAVPSAAPIAAEIDSTMSALEHSLRTGSPPGRIPDLRGSQRQLTKAMAAGITPEQRRGALLAALLDPLVDSIDSAADLLRAGAPDGHPVRHDAVPDRESPGQAAADAPGNQGR